MRFRSLHISLIFLLLVGSTGLVVNKHFCQDILRDVRIFAEAPTCHQQPDTEPACPLHAPTEDEQPRNNCCDSSSDYYKLDTEQPEAEPAPLPLHFPAPIGGATAHFAFNPPPAFPAPDRYLHYQPPLLTRDRTVTLQVFLC